MLCPRLRGQGPKWAASLKNASNPFRLHGGGDGREQRPGRVAAQELVLLLLSPAITLIILIRLCVHSSCLQALSFYSILVNSESARGRRQFLAGGQCLQHSSGVQFCRLNRNPCRLYWAVGVPYPGERCCSLGVFLPPAPFYLLSRPRQGSWSALPSPPNPTYLVCSS